MDNQDLTLIKFVRNIQNEHQKLGALLAQLDLAASLASVPSDEMTATHLEAAKNLAEKLHEEYCHEGHTEGCSWFYENDRKQPWEEHTHKRALDYALQLMSGKKVNVWF